MKSVLAPFALCAFSASVNAQILDESLRLNLETPRYQHHIGQIGQIRGWALHPSQVVEVVEIYIDGEFWSEVPVGGQRNDVYNAYPEAVNSRYSGWAQTVNFKDFSEGYHELEIRAYTNLNRYNTVTGQFCVEKFAGKNFIKDAESIDFKTLEYIHMAKNALLLERISIDGTLYNMEIHWDTATQGFIVEQVEFYDEDLSVADSDYEGWCTICNPEGE